MEKTRATAGRAQRVGSQTPARELREEIPIGDRILVSEIEAAALVGVSRWTFRKWKDRGLIAPVTLPLGVKRNLYRVEDVRALAILGADRERAS